MADPDSNYVSNEYISAIYYNSEKIPDPNLIPETRLITLKKRVDRFLNKRMGKKLVDENVSDEYGELAEYAVQLFGLAIAGLPLFISREDSLIIKRWYTSSRGVHNATA